MSKKYKIFLRKEIKKYIIKDPFEELLENIINNKNNEKENLEGLIDKALLKYSEFYFDNNLNPKSKARVIYVSPEELPSGIGWKVLGQYNPSTHTIYIANNLSPNVEKFVYYHEEAHSIGIYDERLADNYAASKVGYDLGRSYDMAA